MTYVPTFDAFADVIDLREIAEAAAYDETAVDFICALLDDIGHPYDDRADAIVQAKEIGDGYESTIIARRYFVEYAEELANDCGMIDHSVSPSWPLYCIDWDRAARDLEMDYSSFTYDGREYLIRSW